MSRKPADVPETLKEAEQVFQLFLAQCGYPTSICWIEASDWTYEPGRIMRVRWPEGNRTVERARALYAVGQERGLGIELFAQGWSGSVTFASIIVPEDIADAQSRMIGPSLKQACATEPPQIVVQF